MIFERIQATGLAHYSYLFGDETAGVCAIIDPRRDVDVYLDLARQHGLRITHILETHIHADYVSGSRELAARTGAPICGGAEGDYQFAFSPLEDGQTITIGEFTLEVIHTPGHTWEHVCFLVSGGEGAPAPWGLFTGDTLFAGEVGRPDIPGKEQEEPLAQALFDSLHNRLLSLGDEIVIYPAHGQGSPCGASIGARQTSTIGYERRHNELLRIADPDRFTDEVLGALDRVPEYYRRMKVINARGPDVLGAIPHLQPLDAAQFEREMAQPNTVVVDSRAIEAFGGAHVPGSLNISLRDAFTTWAGRLLELIPPDGVPGKRRILLVTEEPSDLETAHIALVRVGHDNVVGYLRNGIRGWTEAGRAFDSIAQMSIHTLKAHIEAGDRLQILDVRSDEEWAEGAIPTARHIYVPDIVDQAERLERSEPIVTYCGSGYRASMAASILARQGFERIYNVPGSITAWEDAGYPLEETGDGDRSD